jgi:hypothetical protein
MTEVEYVYTRPAQTKKSLNKLEVLIFVVIVIASAYFLFFYKGNNINNQNSNASSNQTFINKTYTVDNENFTITSLPSVYKKSEGLDYLRNHSAAEIAKAKSLCTDMLKGEWIDTIDVMGCNNMQGFSTDFCSRDIIQTLVSLCNQINGNPECSIDKVVCSV